MIAKPELTQSNAQQNIVQLQNPTMEVTMSQQQQNHCLRTDSSLSQWGPQMHFTGTKSSP